MGKPILIVDDNSELGETLCGFLKMKGFDAISIATGEGALAMMNEEAPALIVLDHNLPDMSGHVITEHMQKQPTLKNIPVILITGDTEPNQIASGNIVESFTKPFDLMELVTTIEDQLGE